MQEMPNIHSKPKIKTRTLRIHNFLIEVIEPKRINEHSLVLYLACLIIVIAELRAQPNVDIS